MRMPLVSRHFVSCDCSHPTLRCATFVISGDRFSAGRSFSNSCSEALLPGLWWFLPHFSPRVSSGARVWAFAVRYLRTRCLRRVTPPLDFSGARATASFRPGYPISGLVNSLSILLFPNTNLPLLGVDFANSYLVGVLNFLCVLGRKFINFIGIYFALIFPRVYRF